MQRGWGDGSAAESINRLLLQRTWIWILGTTSRSSQPFVIPVTRNPTFLALGPLPVLVLICMYSPTHLWWNVFCLKGMKLERCLSGLEHLVSCRGPQWISVIPMGFITIFQSSSRWSDTFFWPVWVPGMHSMHRHIWRQNTHSHKIKINLVKN